MNILITGANGFLGSHLCTQAASIGTPVAAIRGGADRSNLDHIPGLHVVELAYYDPSILASQLMELKTAVGPIDLIIHNAGNTLSSKRNDYFVANLTVTSNLTHALNRSQLLAGEGCLVYVSSMAARGPVGQKGPVSAYGESKREAEKAIMRTNLDYLIFRPAAIYGPRDKAFLSLFKSLKRYSYPTLTPAEHKMKMIHAHDAAVNILHYAQTARNQVIHLDDGEIYTHESFHKALDEAFGRRSIAIPVPSQLVRLALIGLESTPWKLPVNVEKFDEISQNWNYDFAEERQAFPLKIRYSLAEGFRDTLKYYREHNLL